MPIVQVRFAVKDHKLVNGWLGSVSVVTLVFLAIVQLLPTSLRAQRSDRVGRLAEVQGVDSIATCDRRYSLPAPPQAVSLVRANAPREATPPDSAILLDRLRVNRFADVRFSVDARRFGDGTFYLAPELWRCPTAAAVLRAEGLSLAGSGVGSYRLASRQERAQGRAVERLLLSVENGPVVVEWGHGLLSVIALGREIRDSGTVFAVVVDSAARRAVLLVREGIVTMAGVTGLQATAGRAFSFGPTGRPTPLTLAGSEAVDDVVYHSRVIWTQPRRPPSSGIRTSSGGNGRFWKVLGGTALVGGAGYLIWDQTHKKQQSQGPYSGGVIIKIPI